MKLKTALLGVGLSALMASVAHAQTYSIGTNKQGSLFFATGTALSKLAVQETGLQFRVAPFGGTNTYLPMVNNGQLAFGLANAGEAHFAYEGTELYKTPNKNLRMIGVMYHINGNYAVAKSSPIKTIKDLKGKRVPTEYTSGVVFSYITRSLLATEGLTKKDVKAFPVSNFVQGVNALISGKVDAAYIPVGSGIGKKAMASISGGWRFISFNNTPEAAKAMNSVFPFGTPQVLKPSKVNQGVDAPTSMFRVVAYLVAGKHVKDDVVYKLTKAVHTGKGTLAKSFGKFKAFRPGAMAAKHSVPYHPGAVKYFKEAKLWPAK